ncbi:MAG: hypothetical protein ABSA58_16295 [Acetobacteraceae bacterium]
MTRRYLMVRAAAYRLLIDATLIDRVREADQDETPVDLSRALGGEAGSLVVTCNAEAQVTHLGVDAVLGLLSLAEEDFVALPSLVAAVAGEDLDGVTRHPVAFGPGDGEHAFRLRLGRSSATAAGSDHRRSAPNQ